MTVARVSEGFQHRGNEFLTGSMMKERNVVFLQDFLSWNINRSNKKSECRIFFHDSPNPFHRSLSYFPDPVTKHDAHDNGVSSCSVHNLSRSKVSLNWLIISWKVASCDTLVTSRIDFRHDHCKWKISGRVDGCQNVHHQMF